MAYSKEGQSGTSTSTKYDVCPICTQALDDKKNVCQIRQKGADGINDASAKRGDDLAVMSGTKVHISCRKHYTNPNEVESTRKPKSTSSNTCTLKRSARVSTGPYESKTDCLFCGHRIVPEKSDYSYVKTETFTRAILESCEKRADNWSFKVKGRIEYFGCDLHAADCLYHHSCSRNFRTGREIPLKFNKEPEVKRKKSGRPKLTAHETAFVHACSFLEAHDEEQLTISDLRNKMKEFLGDEDSLPYSSKYFKSKLKERYGNSIHIAEGEGLNDIVTMREKTSQILRSHYKQEEGDVESQKRAIIETAARLIRSDIKTNVASITDQYPSTEMIKVDSALAFIPETLRFFLDSMFVGTDTRRKVAGIGQAIIQAVRPRGVIAPLQIGLGIQLHHLYRSRFIIDTLYEMGFCSSYREILQFEKNAANCVAPDIISETLSEETTVLFAADNVDHNIRTIDGKGTFHGMGMVAGLTPAKKTSRIITRRKISDIQVAENSQVKIVDFRFAKHAGQSIKFQALPHLIHECDMLRIDILWELAFSFKQTTPNWSGMMHTIHQGNKHPGQSSVTFLPMIDMYSGDKICISSTLEYLCNLAAKHHVSPIITFDQPLYWKAAEIITDAPQHSTLKGIVLRLGCFHTFMNLLGAIGTLMGGTGLKKVLETVYGENAVEHMMTGKAVQRAFRGHLLIDKCLHGMIVSTLIEECPEYASLVVQAEDIYSEVMSGERTLESALSSETMTTVKRKLEEQRNTFRTRSKTSQLWLNYQKMLQIARTLITADRTGSWTLHLRAVAECLPIFAAAGHFNYLKSAYFYLQEMVDLETKHPDVFKKFIDGFHVIRRTDQFWAGLNSDLVIEQTLMRSLKSSGGLTHGSGMTDEQRSLWIMAMPITSEYNDAMQEFTDLLYTTSAQHKDSSEARVRRDISDLSKITSKLTACTPFSPDPSLRNIVNGVVASPEVDVHKYESIGKQIIERMIGQPVFSVSFKRKTRAKTLADMSRVKIMPDLIIDSALLFQRFLVVSKSEDISLEEVMSYELSPYPPALFESRDTLRKADKPQLSHAIADHVSKVSSRAINSTPTTEHFVLDGGSLLHRVQWKAGDSYGTIARSYANFTVRHYGLATVVFDGYSDGPSIKDSTHKRRGQNVHPVVNFDAETEFSGKRDEFLSRDCNKQGLINLISEELKKQHCSVINAPGDADVYIAKAAVESAQHRSTTLIGEDTDLLVLLLHYADVNNKELYFRSDKVTKVYDIRNIKSVLGEEVCSQLLFLHAYTGCDSTSRIYGIGKKSIFHKFLKGDTSLRSCASTFIVPGKSKKEIQEFGITAMKCMFGGNSEESLASLRYNMFVKKLANAKTFITPERLPPTADSTKYHSMRSYYQVMVWIGHEEGMDVCDWGWAVVGNTLVPLMSDMDAAPSHLLKMVHCNCSTACKTTRCSCRRYGLPCHSACGQCQVDNCDNPNNKAAELLDDDGQDE